jgi:hypothetical protein
VYIKFITITALLVFAVIGIALLTSIEVADLTSKGMALSPIFHNKDSSRQEQIA